MGRLVNELVSPRVLLPALLAASLASTGCATRYQPRSAHRLSVVMEDGSLAYHRDGETIKHGFFGGGLVEAVEEDPAAREAAATYRGRMAGSFISMTAGFVCFIGGVAWAVSEDSSGSGLFSSDAGAIYTGALGCLLAGAIAGSVLAMSAQPYHFDAINIYNDNAETRAYRFQPPVLPAPGPAPGSPPPPPTATTPPAPAQPPTAPATAQPPTAPAPAPDAPEAR
jgi:hypothetical protein